MATLYRNRSRDNGPNLLAVLLLGALCLFVFGIVVYSLREKDRDDADMTRALELRVEAGDIRVKLSQLPRDAPQADRLSDRLREVAAEHNAILSRHPTWTLSPLEPTTHPLR
jgi:hypothetical protein